MYINDLSQVVQDVQLHLYADDVQLYLSRPIGLLEDCIARINDDLARIYEWSISNCLSLNPNKSQCLAIHNSSFDPTDIPCVYLSNSPLHFVDSVTNLGIKLNGLLSCCDHVKLILSKIYGGLRRLWLSASILSSSIRLKLVKSLIIPHFTYGSTIYPKLDSVCARKLEVAFNDCLRFVFGIPRWHHISRFRLSLVGCSLNAYLKRKALIFLYNLVHTGVPGYLYEQIHFLQSSRRNDLLIPHFRSSSYEGSYFVQVARVWNSLPVHIQRASSVNLFRRLISELDL